MKFKLLAIGLVAILAVGIAAYAILQVGQMHITFTSNAALTITPSSVSYSLGSIYAGDAFSKNFTSPDAQVHANTPTSLVGTLSGNLTMFSSLTVKVQWCDVVTSVYFGSITLTLASRTGSLLFSDTSKTYTISNPLYPLIISGTTNSTGSGQLTVVFTYGS
jgi:hypothetical protein